MNLFIKEKLPKVRDIAKSLSINELYFFGSSVNGNFIVGSSDLDVFIKTDLSNIKSVVKLKIQLSKLFNCHVDIFHDAWSRHPELDEFIRQNKQLIYCK